MSSERLQHDFQSFLASMRMSRHSFFIFVEGDLDYYIFNKICKNELISKRMEYEVVMSSCFNGDGGKEVIINYFDFMRSQTALIDKFKGKVTASLFFVDKDLDDFTKNLRKSPHIVYTENYEIENYLFKHSEICEGISALIPKNVETIKECLGEYGEWRKNCVETWKDWMKMCFFARTTMNGSICSYGAPHLESTTMSLAQLTETSTRNI